LKAESHEFKVFLIHPSFQPHWSKSEPTGLLTLSSVLKMHGYDTELIDLNVEPDYKSLIPLKELGKCIACIGIITKQADEGYHVSRYLKHLNPEIITIFGGIHATFMPYEPFESGNADFVIKGESELSLIKLLDEIKKDSKADYSQIKGIVYKSGITIKENSGCEIVENLDSLPFPDYDLLDFEKYNTSIHFEFPGKSVHLLTSRGCPNDCSFCASPSFYGRRVRFRSPENVLVELKMLVQKYNIRKIHFHDDNFLIEPKRIEKLCRMIIDSKLGLKWVALSDVHSINKNQSILELMRESGCQGIELGVESYDEFALEELNKKVDHVSVIKANSLLKAKGIKPLYLLMAYIPGNNIDSPFKTLKLIYDLINDTDIDILPNFTFNSDTVMSHLFRISPGAKIFNDNENLGIQFSKIWSDHNEERINFIPYSFLKDIPTKTNLSYYPQKVILENFEMILSCMYSNFYGSHDTMIKIDDGMFKLLLFEVFQICENRDVLDIYNVIRKKHLNLNLKDICSVISMLSIIRLVRSKSYSLK
jgi:anaerobic magnesium-protoporphyrin IX monomethyl ester cyclase